ncbi:36324_t:CDS:2 [Gigaspora margarita]|uniref:36324_t:CDS:1 n=1 Tax=Gigaspora margarita TaxID=4874 RepID=A0ABM8VVM5_GIGMA|nr:36324_t:CDS:2 [Gigaspora margarita]
MLKNFEPSGLGRIEDKKAYDLVTQVNRLTKNMWDAFFKESGDISGFTKNFMFDFIDLLSDKILDMCGYIQIFPKEFHNPFPFMEINSMFVKTDFFSTENTFYQFIAQKIRISDITWRDIQNKNFNSLFKTNKPLWYNPFKHLTNVRKKKKFITSTLSMGGYKLNGKDLELDTYYSNYKLRVKNFNNIGVFGDYFSLIKCLSIDKIFSLYDDKAYQLLFIYLLRIDQLIELSIDDITLIDEIIHFKLHKKIKIFYLHLSDLKYDDIKDIGNDFGPNFPFKFRIRFLELTNNFLKLEDVKKIISENKQLRIIKLKEYMIRTIDDESLNEIKFISPKLTIINRCITT